MTTKSLNCNEPDPKLAADIAALPRKPGVYQFLDAQGETMYVGKSSDLRARVRSYFRGNTRGKKILVLARKIQDIRFTVTSSEVEALLLEQSLIKELQPRYNVILRDGKSYAYIRLTDHEFPALEQYRGARKEGWTLLRSIP